MLIVKCCLCGAIISETKGDRERGDITHTYCDVCLKKLMNEHIGARKNREKNFQPEC